jgi:hypothetical protein
MYGVERNLIGVLGTIPSGLKDEMELAPGVIEVVPISKSYKLASRDFDTENSTITVGEAIIGGPEPVIMAGTCSVEDEDQMVSTVKPSRRQVLKSCGAEPSNPVPLPTVFEAWVLKDWNCSTSPNKRPACRSSPRSWPSNR